MHGGCAAFLIDAYVSLDLVYLHYRVAGWLAGLFAHAKKNCGFFLLQMYYARVPRRLAQPWSISIDGRCVPCPSCLVSENFRFIPFPVTI